MRSGRTFARRTPAVSSSPSPTMRMPPADWNSESDRPPSITSVPISVASNEIGTSRGGEAGASPAHPLGPSATTIPSAQKNRRARRRCSVSPTLSKPRPLPHRWSDPAQTSSDNLRPNRGGPPRPPWRPRGPDKAPANSNTLKIFSRGPCISLLSWHKQEARPRAETNFSLVFRASICSNLRRKRSAAATETGHFGGRSEFCCDGSREPT